MTTLDDYAITTDAQRFDIAAIHAYLTRSYWSPGIPRAIVERAIANSICFGVLKGSDQVGFARVVTDRATFAYLADVFILDYRQFGFNDVARPASVMEIRNANPYQAA